MVELATLEYELHQEKSLFYNNNKNIDYAGYLL